MSKITEATLIPISLVVAIIGGVVWLSVMYQRVEAHQEKLQVIDKKQDGIVEKQKLFEHEIIDRLARIETKQDAILRKEQ